MSSSESTLSFGTQFRHWRQSAGFSASHIARLAGTAPSFISHIESGLRPMPDTVMRRLADCKELGLSLETLLSWKLLAGYDTQVLQQALEVAPETSAISKKGSQRIVELSQDTGPIPQGASVRIVPVTRLDDAHWYLRMADKKPGKPPEFLRFNASKQGFMPFESEDITLSVDDVPPSELFRILGYEVDWSA